MRHSGVVILLIFISCKVAQPPAAIPIYEEDVSVHRPQMDSSDVVVQNAGFEEFVPLTGHIKTELDSIIQISVALNKEEKLVDGYIIQVYTGNSRDRANQVWNHLDRNFPELSPKISYHQPNFRVKAGKFTNRLEAHRVYKEVKEDFPKSLLVPERFVMKYE